MRDTASGLCRWVRARWHHRTLGEVYLLVTAAGALAFGVTLLFAPHSHTTGPSLATLYSLAPRSTWGVVFLALAALALFAAWHPTDERFIAVMSIEVFAQAAWAVGLTIPSLSGGSVSSFLAPIAWLQLAAGALVVITSGRRPVLPPPARGRRSTDPER